MFDFTVVRTSRVRSRGLNICLIIILITIYVIISTREPRLSKHDVTTKFSIKLIIIMIMVITTRTRSEQTRRTSPGQVAGIY